MEFEQKSASKSRLKNRIFTGVVIAVSASALFFSGWGIGSGRIKFRGLEPRVSNVATNGEIDFTSIEELYSELKQNFDGQLDIEKLIDGLKEGLAKATNDPYTEYFNEEASKAFDEQLSGSFSGIGAELGKEDQNIVIIAPIEGTPAARAGLRPRDVVAAINDEVAVDLSINEAVEKIRGEAGTKVKLTIIRGNTERIDLEITREKINIPSVKWKVENGIGILTVSRFWEDTAGLAREAAAEFKKANVSKVIMDLRDNPGGQLDAAVDLTSLWLDQGQLVLREKRGDKVTSELKAKGNPVFKNMQTVVLINDGSASASEITAGALQDHQVATLIGVKSFGKGSVQQLIDLAGGGSVKITIARWFTPKDKNIDKTGIEPDKKVERSVADIQAGRDPQLDAARAEFRN